MAGEEDTELRDLVAQTLEAKGVLGKIRVIHFFGAPIGLIEVRCTFQAQLRAQVFLALEEQEAEKVCHTLYMCLVLLVTVNSSCADASFSCQ